MAIFVNKPFLTVIVDEGIDRAVITVQGQLEFSELDRSLMQSGLVFTLRGRLMGSDSGLFGSDDFLLNMGSRSFTGTQPARVSWVLQRSNIAKSVLNEDAGEDELFADLQLSNSLTNTVVARASSQQVVGSF
jgi:hypothetical protein